MAQEELTVDIIMQDTEFLEAVTGTTYKPPKHLQFDEYVILVPIKLIHENIINVSKNVFSQLQTKWCETKSIGVRSLFEELAKEYNDTNLFVPVAHTDNDYPKAGDCHPKKDLCIIKERCAVHSDNCGSR